MNVVGTTYLNGCNYQIGYDVLSTNQEYGYHTIRIYGVLNVTNYYVSWTRGYARVWDNNVEIGTYYSRGSYTLVTKDIDVYADSQGKVSVYMDGSLDTTFVSGSVSGTAYLPDISRFPSLLNGQNFTDKDNPVFNIKAYGTYTIKVKLGAGGNSSIAQRVLDTKNSTQYTLVLTDEERETLVNLMVDNKVSVAFTVAAVDNGNEIHWDTKTYTMTGTKKNIKIRINGEWKEATPYIRVNNTWKEATPYIRVNSTWKEGI